MPFLSVSVRFQFAVLPCAASGVPYEAIFFYLLPALCFSQNALASDTSGPSDELALNAKQVQALGVVTAALPAKQSGVVSGLPAQVVIPHNQLFVISTPFPAMVEQTLVGVGDSVRKGQPIARLQSPALVEAQRGLLQARCAKPARSAESRPR